MSYTPRPMTWSQFERSGCPPYPPSPRGYRYPTYLPPPNGNAPSSPRSITASPRAFNLPGQSSTLTGYNYPVRPCSPHSDAPSSPRFVPVSPPALPRHDTHAPYTRQPALPPISSVWAHAADQEPAPPRPLREDMPARHVHAAPRAPSPLLRPASSRAAAAASASDMSELNLDEDALIWLDTTLPSGAPPAFNLLTPFPIIPPGVDNVEEYLLRQHLRTLEERCTIGGWRAEVAGATQPDAERVADEEDELDSDSEGGGGSLVGGEYTDSMEEEDELEDDEEGGTDQATVTEADAMEEEERHQREGTSASEEAQLAESIALLCASLYPSFFPASEAQREREWGAFAEYTRARSGETAHLLPGYVPSRAGPRTEHLPAFPSDHFDAWRIPQVAPATDGRIDPDYIVDASDDGDEVWGPDVGGPFCLPPTGAHPPRWVPGVRPARRAPSVSVRFNHRNVPYARAPAVRAGYV